MNLMLGFIDELNKQGGFPWYLADDVALLAIRGTKKPEQAKQGVAPMLPKGGLVKASDNTEAQAAWQALAELLARMKGASTEDLNQLLQNSIAMGVRG